MNNINNLNPAAEVRVAYQIKRQLNAGLADISSDKLEQLRAAREQALTKQKRGAAVLAPAGGKPVALPDGFFYLEAMDAFLSVLEKDPLNEQALASYAAADGALFVRTEKHLYRFEIR